MGFYDDDSVRPGDGYVACPLSSEKEGAAFRSAFLALTSEEREEWLAEGCRLFFEGARTRNILAGATPAEDTDWRELACAKLNPSRGKNETWEAFFPRALAQLRQWKQRKNR